MKNFPFTLYHGTSSLFLKDILEFGLGGKNPIKDFNLFEFANRLWPYVESHLAPEDDFAVRAFSFSKMVSQKAGKSNGFNFQHGDTYVSPSEFTATSYTIGNTYGSEFLTYTLDFLRELVSRNVPGINDTLYQAFPRIFGFLDALPSPLIIGINNCPIDSVVTEQGECAKERVLDLISKWEMNSKSQIIFGQQQNFRLKSALPADSLNVFLINILHPDPFKPCYQKIALDIKSIDTIN